MIVAIILFLIGMALSAFFSGCETGFYRATRVRLRLDAIQGDRFAHGLIWLANNPALFVATTLIGNNLANYVTSLAMVLGASSLGPSYRAFFQSVAPLLFSPIVFVYGELLPKNLFYQAPNRLLRFAGPVFLGFSLLFLPVSAVLWLLGRALRYLVGESPEQLRLSLARQELQRVFDEGHEVGLLRPLQRQVAQGMLTLVDEPLSRFMVPMARVPSVRIGMPTEEVRRIARRNQVSRLLVIESNGRRVLGYVRVLDLRRSSAEQLTEYRELLAIGDNVSPISALTTMQAESTVWARVVNASGHTIGLLQSDRLVDSVIEASVTSRSA